MILPNNDNNRESDDLRPPRYEGRTIARYAVRLPDGHIYTGVTMDEVWQVLFKARKDLTTDDLKNVEVGCLTNGAHGFVNREAAEEIAFHTGRELNFTSPKIK